MSDVLDSLINILLAGKNKVTGGLPVQNSKNLFYYSLDPGDDPAVVKAYAQYSLGGADTVLLTSFDDLARDLGQRSAMQYDQLVISSHGSGGAIRIGPSPMDLAQLVSGWTRQGIKLPTVTGTIALEGCDIGQKTENMFAFAGAFHAQQVTAWTKLHGWGINAFPMPSGSNDVARRKAFDKKANPYGPYLLPESPSLDSIYASTRPGGQVILPHEWFAEEGNDQKLTDAIATTDPAFLDVKFYPRSKAEEKNLFSRGEALLFDSEPSQPDSTFYHIFVKILAPPSH